MWKSKLWLFDMSIQEDFQKKKQRTYLLTKLKRIWWLASENFNWPDKQRWTNFKDLHSWHCLYWWGYLEGFFYWCQRQSHQKDGWINANKSFVFDNASVEKTVQRNVGIKISKIDIKWNKPLVCSLEVHVTCVTL